MSQLSKTYLDAFGGSSLSLLSVVVGHVSALFDGLPGFLFSGEVLPSRSGRFFGVVSARRRSSPSVEVFARLLRC